VTYWQSIPVPHDVIHIENIEGEVKKFLTKGLLWDVSPGTLIQYKEGENR